MKGAKGRFLKKLKSIRPIEALKQGHAIQVISSPDGWLDRIFQDPNRKPTSPFVLRERDHERANQNQPEELLRDLVDEEMEFGDKENIGPAVKSKGPSAPTKPNSQNLISSQNLSPQNHPPLSELGAQSSVRPADTAMASEAQESAESITQLSELDVSSFRRPDMNSVTLFDPKLLLAFEQAVMDHMRAQEVERRARAEEQKFRTSDETEPETVSETREVEGNPLLEFEEKCPPGGSEKVILYTTSLRGIRKTFEDCSSIRFLLGSFRIVFHERDVSMHLGFREELWRILGGRVVPPRLFIRGRYIGGADEVVGLHEQGKLLRLFRGVPRDQLGCPCGGCGGVRFVLCFNCNGSRKVGSNGGEDAIHVQCLECNENGLVVCPFCC